MMVELSDTLYERYMRDVAVFPRITPEREIQLSATILSSRNARKVQAAVHELVQANLLLVIHCLKEFAGFLDSPGVRITPMDLISEGNIGLVHAARNYDAGGCSLPRTARRVGWVRVRFSTYACKSIRNAMRRAIKLSRFIHVPEHHFGYWSRMRTLRDAYGENLTDALLERDLGVGAAKLHMLKQSQDCCVALLDDMGASEGEDSRWSETIEDPAAVKPSGDVDGRDMREFLFAEMQVLPARTQQMLRMLYVDGTAETFSDLSRVFGISKERCRQICARGLEILRQRIEAKGLRAVGVAGSAPRAAVRPRAANRLHVVTRAVRPGLRLRPGRADMRQPRVHAA